MYYPHFDISTLILYLITAYLSCFLFKLAISKPFSFAPNYNSSIFYFSLWFLFTTLASIRLVSYGTGGTDAIVYENLFINAKDTVEGFEEKEVLFGFAIRRIRQLTDNPLIFRTICYGFISLSYVKTVKFFSSPSISVIPLMVILLFYLKSFNTMRTSLAVAIFLFSLILLYQKKYLLSIIALFICPFIHRMSILYLPFPIAYVCLSSYICKVSLNRFIIYLLIYSIFSFVLAQSIQSFMIAGAFLDGTDAYYLSMNQSSTLLNSAILIIPLTGLLIFWRIVNIPMCNTRKEVFLKICISYDIITAPAAVILGLWRFNEFLFLPRLLFWGYLIGIFYKKFGKNSRTMLALLFFLLFSLWLIYRILKEYEPCGFMPYFFYWQK